MIGFKQVKLYVPVLLFKVNVGIVTLVMVKLVATLQPPAAVTVTEVTPGLKPLAEV